MSSADKSPTDTRRGGWSVVQPAELSPADLIAACVEDGGPTFWEEFVRRFRPVLLGAVSTACRRCGLDPNEHRDDLLQEVFLKIWDHRALVLRRFVSSNENAAFAYLKVVAVHTCLDWLRARRAAKRGGSTGGAERARIVFIAHPTEPGVGAAGAGRSDPADRSNPPEPTRWSICVARSQHLLALLPSGNGGGGHRLDPTATTRCQGCGERYRASDPDAENSP